MKIFISETHRQNARRIALQNIARFFKISEWEFKSNEELLEDLSSLKNKDTISIIKLLKKYFEAYDAWFSFYQKRKKLEEETGEEYRLKVKEHLQLDKLILDRENTLNALQQKFDELQLSEFNRKNFGTDISGIVISK